MRIPEHIKLLQLQMGENGQLQLPPELAEQLDLTPGCRLLLRADTREGVLTVQRMYGFVPQVLEEDGISEEARQLAAEIMAAWTEEGTER